MPKSYNQKLKLLYLKDILENYTDEAHMISTNSIIEKLASYGISAERKSIYNDIEQLRAYGIDIITEKQKSNCYYIAQRHFELPELKLLVDSVQSSKFLTLKKSEQLIKKLESLCSQYEASQLQRQVFVSDRIKNMNESIYYSVDYIHNAISENKKISFKYFYYDVNKQQVFRKNGKKYVVSPYSLMWDDENYYLLAFDSESGIFKHYRVDKISGISIVDESRDGSDEFKKIDLSKYNKKFFSMFGGETVKVKMRFSNELVGVVIDRFGKDISMIKCDDEHFEINAEVAVSPQFYGFIFSLCGKAKIISPEIAVNGFKQMIKSV